MYVCVYTYVHATHTHTHTCMHIAYRCADSLARAHQVKPLLDKYRVDAYLAGHDHTLQVKADGTSMCFESDVCKFEKVVDVQHWIQKGRHTEASRVTDTSQHTNTCDVSTH